MGRTNSGLIGIVLVVVLTVPTKAQDQVVYVSTLDWPPYTASDLPRGGATSDVVHRAFDQAGYRAEFTYHSWKQAIEMAVNGTQGVIAYFPGYHCRHQQGFVASDPVGSGVLGFAEHVDSPITWDTLDSLSEQKLKIGTVMGYANTNEFDAKVGTGHCVVLAACGGRKAWGGQEVQAKAGFSSCDHRL